MSFSWQGLQRRTCWTWRDRVSSPGHDRFELFHLLTLSQVGSAEAKLRLSSRGGDIHQHGPEHVRMGRKSQDRPNCYRHQMGPPPLWNIYADFAGIICLASQTGTSVRQQWLCLIWLEPLLSVRTVFRRPQSAFS